VAVVYEILTVFKNTDCFGWDYQCRLHYVVWPDVIFSACACYPRTRPIILPKPQWCNALVVGCTIAVAV